MAHPSVADGEPHGPAPAAVAPSVGDSSLPDGTSPGAMTPRSAGEPDTLPLTWCKKCEADVLPSGKGKCPRCGIFLRQNFVARRHPVNVLRRDALLAELVAEFTPGTILERSNCAHLAATLEQLEVMKPGSTEWQRLVTVAQTLGATLHDERSREPRTPTTFDGMSASELADRAEQVATRLREIADREAESATVVAKAVADANSQDCPSTAPRPS